MSDPFTPPPDVPLDDGARARLRERVLDGTGDAASRRAWLLPLAAAAAVAAVAGGTALVVAVDGEEGSSGPTAPGLSSDPPPLDTPTDEPTADPTAEPTDEPTAEPTVAATADPTGGTPTAECVREARGVLPDGVPVATLEDPRGTTTFFFAAPGRYTLCDTHGGRATVHHPRSTAGGGDRDPFEVSTLFHDGGLTFVAGGLVPDGALAYDLTYRFPDGHLERSTTFEAGDHDLRWWVVEYTATEGVLVAPGTNQLDLDPIEVTLSLSGTQETHELRWALDTCAQANHGC